MVASAPVAIWRASFGDFSGATSDHVDHFVELPCKLWRAEFSLLFTPALYA